ncbi:MAG: ferrous iron transport protein A [Synergistaceae bacterium]|nr:ferrous iron transport protein A [Synergistaceae bacterium]
MRKCLNEFTPGETGTVVRVAGAGAGKGLQRQRLFDMGITPGAEITMRKAAPLGDPMEITIRGYELSVRKVEVEAVLMECGEK